MEFGNYRLDLKLTAYWVIGIAIVISAVILASSYFGDSADLELKIDDEVEMGEEVTLKARYPGDSPEITVEGDVIGEGSVTYSFDESGNYTVSAEAKGERVERTVSVVESQPGSDSTGDEDGTGQGQNDPDGEQKNTEDSTEEDDTQQDGDQTEEDSDSDDLRGIELDSDPVAGTTNRIILYDQGERIGGETVYIDGEELGQTGPDGTIQFEVPNVQEIKVKASGYSEKTYEVSESLTSSEVQLLSPSNGDVFSNSSLPTSVQFDFEKPEDATYQLVVDDQLKAEGGQSTEKVQDKVQLGEGTHQAYIRALRDDLQAESETVSFDVTEDVELEFDETRDGESYPIMNHHIGEIAFSIEGGADEYSIEVDGETVEEGDADFSNYYEHRFQEAGEHSIVVKALYKGSVKDQIQGTVQAQDPPQPQITWLNNTVDTSTPELFFEVETDVEYDVEATVTGSEGEQAMYYKSSRVDPSTTTHSKETVKLPQGTHEYSITAKDQTGTEIGSQQGTFETTAERPLADIQSLEYEKAQGSNQISFKASVYEDYSYEIKIDGATQASGNRNAEDISLSKEIGALTSGQQYTATLNLESKETDKTATEQIQFTAQ